MARKSIQPETGIVVSAVDPRFKGRINVTFEPTENQHRVLLCPAFEVFAGGMRAGGKSVAGRLFMIKGNQAFLPEPRKGPDGLDLPCDISYIYDPDYSGLVLRRNYEDMGNWIDGARKIYSPIGGEYLKSDKMFVFRNIRLPDGRFIKEGGRIYLGHLESDDAWEKYLGHEYARINIEELPLIDEERRYLMVMASARLTAGGKFYPQIFASGNPAGRGAGWVRRRFPRAKDKNGERIPDNTIFWHHRGSDGRDLGCVPLENWDPREVLKLYNTKRPTRIYIPMPMSGNPHMDDAYRGILMQMSPAEQAVMLHGDWDALLEGRYFEEFRVKNLDGEPPEACHVTPPVPLAPHWDRWMGCDVGFAHESAVYWACKNEEDQRIHVYREMVTKGVPMRILGTKIAQASLDDLLANTQNPVMTLYLSWEAVQTKRQGSYEKNLAEQLAEGIADVLGNDGVLIPELVGEEAASTFFREAAGETPRIVIRAAARARVAGWHYIRELLRWWSASDDSAKPMYNIGHAVELVKNAASPEEGQRLLRDYEKQLLARRGEVLPKLKIWDTCPKIIEQLQELVRDDKDPEDVDKKGGRWDRADAFRYCLYSHTNPKANAKPKDIWMEEWMRKHWGNRELDARQTYYAQRKAESDWEKERRMATAPVKLPSRRSGRAGLRL